MRSAKLIDGSTGQWEIVIGLEVAETDKRRLIAADRNERRSECIDLAASRAALIVFFGDGLRKDRDRGVCRFRSWDYGDLPRVRGVGR